MISLNMLPEVKREFLRARQVQARVISIAVILSIVSISLVALAGAWVYGAQTIQKSLLTDSIDENYKELRSIKDIDRYVTVQNQLTQIDGLHAKKAILSRVFDVVDKLNPQAPNNVRVSTLDIDTVGGVMTFKGEVNSFTGLETFRDTLKNAELLFEGSTKAEKLFPESPGNPSVAVVNQSIGKNASGAEVVSFEVVARYNIKVFAFDTKNPRIVVPNKETTQTKDAAPSTFSQPTTTETTR